MKPTTGIAEFLCVRPDGERLAVTVAIGHPFAGSLLRAFVVDGGRILDPRTGNDVPLHGYFELARADRHKVKRGGRRP